MRSSRGPPRLCSETPESSPLTEHFDAQRFLRNLSPRPGVYRMLDADGEILYVGKAHNLNSRLSSYFRGGSQSPKTRALLAHTADVQVTITRNDAEALLLENNLIKEHRPRYNVLLRDDKSYPYILITDDHTYPQITFHRGAQRRRGRYFGPYPSARSVRASLKQLQRLFGIRQCEDSFFANRTRPCLQYQINRCSAPCVGYIGPEAYARDVENAVHFLQGRSSVVIDALIRDMEAASERQEYEKAARYRDQISNLRRLQERQDITGEQGDLDLVAAVRSGDTHCVALGIVRGGRHLGHQTFFPSSPEATDERELRAAFLGQYYPDRELPGEILVDGPVEQGELIESTLSEQAGRRVRLRHRLRGERARWIEMLRTNAEEELAMRLASSAGMSRRLEALTDALDLESRPERIECFDVSHTMGEATVASCVVFNREGPVKSDYRRFNIRGAAAGDDYAAMSEVLERRYSRLKREEAKLPDLVLVDGGAGQLAQAQSVLQELQIDEIQLVAVAKGSERRPGQEQLFVSGREEPVRLHDSSAALHLIQQIRDEAHRFAVTGHRQRRANARNVSPLEQIPGLGPKRRRELLKRFGGLRQVSRAGVQELATVPGISQELARRIYDNFHTGRG